MNEVVECEAGLGWIPPFHACMHDDPCHVLSLATLALWEYIRMYVVMAGA